MNIDRWLMLAIVLAGVAVGLAAISLLLLIRVLTM